jgi:hypothetical protein
MHECSTFIHPSSTVVHGQHRAYKPPLTSPTKCDGIHYRLVTVPPLARVRPLVPSKTPDGQRSISKPRLACNYSMTKVIAAIVQIIYASYELYQARGLQVERYGYAAFSLTVTPYLLMSFLNLIATACEPQYPAVYIVRFREFERSDDGNQVDPADERALEENVSGAVGEVYWDPHVSKPPLHSAEI